MRVVTFISGVIVGVGVTLVGVIFDVGERGTGQGGVAVMGGLLAVAGLVAAIYCPPSR